MYGPLQLFQLGRSEDEANVCRVYCEELEIPFYRFSPEVGEQVGTAEVDTMKICDSIIRLVESAILCNAPLYFVYCTVHCGSGYIFTFLLPLS